VKIIRPSMDTSKTQIPLSASKHSTLQSIEEAGPSVQSETTLDALSVNSRVTRDFESRGTFLKKACQRMALLQGAFLAPMALHLICHFRLWFVEFQL
jgi:hypothetical protein